MNIPATILMIAAAVWVVGFLLLLVARKIRTDLLPSDGAHLDALELEQIEIADGLAKTGLGGWFFTSLCLAVIDLFTSIEGGFIWFGGLIFALLVISMWFGWWRPTTSKPAAA